MNHLNHLAEAETELPDGFIQRVTGRFYTPKAIASHMIAALLREYHDALNGKRTVHLCDPFAGDGRLVRWLLSAWIEAKLPLPQWRITLIDLHEDGLASAEQSIRCFCAEHALDAEVDTIHDDSFLLVDDDLPSSCDIVVTNPPWELLKPDTRELDHLESGVRDGYVTAMREYDALLAGDAQVKRGRFEAKTTG